MKMFGNFSWDIWRYLGATNAHPGSEFHAVSWASSSLLRYYWFSLHIYILYVFIIDFLYIFISFTYLLLIFFTYLFQSISMVYLPFKNKSYFLSVMFLFFFFFWFSVYSSWTTFTRFVWLFGDFYIVISDTCETLSYLKIFTCNYFIVNNDDLPVPFHDLTVAQIINSLLPNSDLNWRK